MAISENLNRAASSFIAKTGPVPQTPSIPVETECQPPNYPPDAASQNEKLLTPGTDLLPLVQNGSFQSMIPTALKGFEVRAETKEFSLDGVDVNKLTIAKNLGGSGDTSGAQDLQYSLSMDVGADGKQGFYELYITRGNQAYGLQFEGVQSVYVNQQITWW